MNSRKQILKAICATLFLLCGTVAAQTADKLFNPPAKEYIYGNTPLASNLVAEALTKFPQDEKLLKLKKLIEEQQKQNQQKQDQKDQQKNKDDQKNQQDQQQQDQQQDQSSQDKQQQNQQKQQQDQQKPSDPSEKEQPQPSQPQQAGEMSKEEAQQLLDAMKQDEHDQRANLKPFLGGPVKVEKDW